jgi:hypothetical protein
VEKQQVSLKDSNHQLNSKASAFSLMPPCP